MATKLKLEEAPDGVWPICPHCEVELRTIWVRTRGFGFLDLKRFLICPHCRKFLGFGNLNYV